MQLGLGLGLTKQQGGGGQSLAQQVEAILAGTTGFALDRTSTANLFQDAAGTVPVTTISDPVGRVNSQWGTTSYDWRQATGGNRGAWNGSGVLYDGVASYFDPFSALGLLNAAPAAFFAERITFTSLAAIQMFMGWSSNVADEARIWVYATATGQIVCDLRRTDGGAVVTATTAAAVVTAGTPATIVVQADCNGTNLLKIWVNGVEQASTAIAAGTFSATNSARARDGANIQGVVGQFYGGTKRKGVYAPFAISAPNRATIEAWLAT
ncbi:MAG: hypothetical protein ACRC14_02675 [Paracoccaceae bacterium]